MVGVPSQRASAPALARRLQRRGAVLFVLRLGKAATDGRSATLATAQPERGRALKPSSPESKTTAAYTHPTVPYAPYRVRVSTPVRNEFFRTERQLATSRCSLRSKKKKESCICMGGGHSFCLPCDAATAASHEIQRRLLPCPREREGSVGPNGHDALLSGPVNMHGPGTPDFSRPFPFFFFFLFSMEPRTN